MKNTKKTLINLTLLTLGLLLASSFCLAHPEPPNNSSWNLEEKFKRTDTNSDGLISKEEFHTMQRRRIEKHFTKIDLNKDDQLSKEEMKEFFRRMRPPSQKK